MEQSAILAIVSGIFSLGIVWGSLNNKIKQLEKALSEHNNLAERLTRIEERIIFIAEKIK